MEVPRWAIEEYPGAEEEFSAWLEDQFIEKFHTDKIKSSMKNGVIVDNDLYERTRAMAKFQVLQRTIGLKSLVNRAEVYQIYQANEKGWFRYLPAEFDTIEELLNAMLDDTNEKSGEYYDITFLINEVLPLAKKAGIQPQEVMGIPINFSKARASVPLMRELLKEALKSDPDETEEEAQEIKPEIKSAIVEVISNINSDMSVSNFKNKMKEMRGIAIGVPEKFSGRKYILNGKEVYIFETRTPVQSRALEISVRNISEEISIGDIKTLFSDIRTIIED